MYVFFLKIKLNYFYVKNKSTDFFRCFCYEFYILIYLLELGLLSSLGEVLRGFFSLFSLPLGAFESD